MVVPLVFLIAIGSTPQAQKHTPVKQPPTAVIEMCNKIAETYVSVLYEEGLGNRTTEKAAALSSAISQLAQGNAVALKEFAGASGSELQADIEAFADIVKDYGAAVAQVNRNSSATTDDEASAREGLMTTLANVAERTRQSNRLIKAIGAIQNVVRDHGTPAFLNSISPVAFYMLIGPILVTPDYKQRKDDWATFVPDPELRGSASLLHHVQTPEDVSRLDTAMKAYGDRVKEAKDAGTLESSGVIYSVPTMPQFASIRPGDTIFALRKGEDQPWKKVGNWRDVALVASGLNVTPPTRIQALIGADEESSKAVEVLAW